MFALRGLYKAGLDLTRDDLDSFDLVILNLYPEALLHYEHVLQDMAGRCAKLVGLYEGDLSYLDERWRQWSSVADRCDLIISINEFGTDYLASLTSSPVSFVGIPYPVDGVGALSVPVEQRAREVFLCGSQLKRPVNYLASRDLGLPMYGFEQTFSRRPRELVRHRSLDKLQYVRRAEQLYNDPNLTFLPQTHLPGYFKRTAQSLLWMNIDPRYTWGRYVLDGAALGIPVITMRGVGNAMTLWPDLLVDSPYDVIGARAIAQRLIEDPAFYRLTIDQAAKALEWHRPEATVERLWRVLGGGL